MRWIRLALGTLALVSCTAVLRAEVPPIIRFQGVLTDENSVPLSGETIVLTFRLYDSLQQGNLVWTQTFPAVDVTNGFYEVALGDPTGDAVQEPELASVPFDQPYFLEITFQRGSEAPVTLQPRKPLGSVPYSFRSAGSDGGQGDSIAVRPDGGLDLRRLGDSRLVEVGIAPLGVLGDMIRDSTITAAKIARDQAVTSIFFSSDSGYSAEVRGDMVIEAGAHVQFLPATGGDGVRIVVESGGGGGGGDVESVFPGLGLQGAGTGGPEVTLWVGEGNGIHVAEDEVSVDTTWVDGRYVVRDEQNAVTLGMIVPSIVSSVNGIEADGENIDLEAGQNISITTDVPNRRIRIDGTGSAGDITSVEAGGGLTGGGPFGDVSVSVGAGDGVVVTPDAVAVDVAAFAGAGLGPEGTNDLRVIVGRGLETFNDSVRLNDAYNDGSAYSGVFVNVNEPGSITSPMIVDGQVTTADLADTSVTFVKLARNSVTSAKILDNSIDVLDIQDNVVSSINGVSNDGGAINFVAAPEGNIEITPNDAANTITLDVSVAALDAPDQANLVRAMDSSRVGVNTPSPDATLHVRQRFPGNGGGIRLEGAGVPNHWETYVDEQSDYYFAFNDEWRAWIDKDFGNYHSWGLAGGSDPLGPTLDRLLQLRPSIAGRGEPRGAARSIGLVAQEVAAVFPEIAGNRNGIEAVDYTALSVVAVRAIQEQQEMIRRQRAEIDDLKRLLDHQEQRLAALERRR